jgi:hypothetical protein
MAPILAFGLLSMPGLTAEHMDRLTKPFFQYMSTTMRRPLKLEELFGVLATSLHFGQKLSDAAAVRTSAHTEILRKICPYVTSVIQLLSFNLGSSLGSSICQDGFEFADDFALAEISVQATALLGFSEQFKIPEPIIQAIVVETCAYIDSLLFNVIIVMTVQFTDDKLSALLQKVRIIQMLFNCLPTNFEAAFPVILEFLAQTMALWMGEVVVKSDRMRSVMELCPRDLPLPWDRLDDIGKVVRPRERLKIPVHAMSFKFTYEWLYTQAASHPR